MVTKDKEYISSVLKTFGFTCFAPFGSVLFQFMVLNKSMFDGQFVLCLLSSLGGFLLLFAGYNIIVEKGTKQ